MFGKNNIQENEPDGQMNIMSDSSSQSIVQNIRKIIKTNEFFNYQFQTTIANPQNKYLHQFFFQNTDQSYSNTLSFYQKQQESQKKTHCKKNINFNYKSLSSIGKLKQNGNNKIQRQIKFQKCKSSILKYQYTVDKIKIFDKKDDIKYNIKDDIKDDIKNDIKINHVQFSNLQVQQQEQCSFYAIVTILSNNIQKKLNGKLVVINIQYDNENFGILMIINDPPNKKEYIRLRCNRIYLGNIINLKDKFKCQHFEFWNQKDNYWESVEILIQKYFISVD